MLWASKTSIYTDPVVRIVLGTTFVFIDYKMIVYKMKQLIYGEFVYSGKGSVNYYPYCAHV